MPISSIQIPQAAFSLLGNLGASQGVQEPQASEASAGQAVSPISPDTSSGGLKCIATA